MAMFNCYVSSPEGIFTVPQDFFVRNSMVTHRIFWYGTCYMLGLATVHAEVEYSNFHPDPCIACCRKVSGPCSPRTFLKSHMPNPIRLKSRTPFLESPKPVISSPSTMVSTMVYGVFEGQIFSVIPAGTNPPWVAMGFALLPGPAMLLTIAENSRCTMLYHDQ